MKTIKYKEFYISVEKYRFSDTYNVRNYYICAIYNNDNEDWYMTVFSANNLTEDDALKQCKRRIDYKNEFRARFTTKSITGFIKQYKDEIDKFNKNYDVEIRWVEKWRQKNLLKE